MSRQIAFKYFYGKEADTFSFFKVPKLLFTDEYFKDLSIEAKVLYGLLLDRMSLSLKNEWFDADGKAYIYFSIEEIGELLGCGKNKAVKSLQELDTETGIGLIEKCKKGQGKATRIYVKNFVLDVEEAVPEVYKSNSAENHEFTNGDSSFPKSKMLEVYQEGANKTNIINTDFSNTESNLILSDDGMGRDWNDEYMAYSRYIREALELDFLIKRSPLDRELLEGIYDLILETVVSKNESVVIASNRYPTELVKSKFLKLNSSHVEYVMDCLRSNTTKVRNIKKYLLAALFNAPTTISGYYSAQVNYDFPQFAKAK